MKPLIPALLAAMLCAPTVAATEPAANVELELLDEDREGCLDFSWCMNWAFGLVYFTGWLAESLTYTVHCNAITVAGGDCKEYDPYFEKPGSGDTD